MHKQKTSKRRAQAFSTALLLVGLAVVSYLQAWWPGMMLVVGSSLALRQYLLGRPYDMGISLLVFGGIFATAQLNVSWKVLLPVLFGVAGIYVLFREYLKGKEETLEEQEEDTNQEIEEDQHK